MEHNYVAEPAAASTEFFANGDTSMLKQSLRRIHQPWSSMVLCLDSSTVVVLLSSILVHNGGTGHGRRCSREGAGERLEIQLVLWSCAQMLGTLKAHSLMSWMFAEAQPKLVREHILNIVCLYWDISYIHIYIYIIYIYSRWYYCKGYGMDDHTPHTMFLPFIVLYKCLALVIWVLSDRRFGAAVETIDILYQP